MRQKARAILIQEMNLNPRQGWVRGNEAVQPGVANELARLSSENEAWEITEYGKDLYAAYRMHQLERAANEQARPGRKAK